MMPNGDGTGDKINLGQLLNFNMREYARNLSAIPTQSKVVAKLVVKLRQGSGKDRQGMAVKAKGLKA